MLRFRILTLLVLGLVSFCRPLSAGDVPTGKTLPDSELLSIDEPLDVVMVRGIHQFALHEINDAREQRQAPWIGSPEKTTAARERLRRIIGMPREIIEHPRLWIAPDGSNDSGAPVLNTSTFQVRACRWDVAPGLTGRGLIATPKGSSSLADLPLVIVVPDADQTPEALFGLTSDDSPEKQIARQYAQAGAAVLCPLLIDRGYELSGHPDIRWTNMPHREYVYRLGFELGLHPVGIETAVVQAGAKAVATLYKTKQTLIDGYGEGGLIALMSAATDAELFDAAIISGYFHTREQVWQEPIYRNLFGQLTEFGDAEIASLIVPRPLVIEAIPGPEVTGPAEPKGRALIAAPGGLTGPESTDVRQEFARADQYYQKVSEARKPVLLEPKARRPVQRPLEMFADRFASTADADAAAQATVQSPSDDFLSERRREQIAELVRYTQQVLERSDNVRAELWSKAEMESPQAFAESMTDYREWVHSSFIGKLPVSDSAFRPRTRRVIDEPTHVGYEVVLDVYPTDRKGDPGVIAGGVLLLPKEMNTGERRPVVVCQHGLEGTPWDTITTDESQRAWRAYKGFATELVKRGFIVYAPQNPYRGLHDFRVLQRLSNPLGRSLFSYIIEQHRQTLKWLASLPWVDADRIGFYGLSYGGKTAVRVPPMLVPSTEEPGYCLSICSADFNDWIRKNASSDDRYSYVYTQEYEIFEWNMAHVANYAELGWLMVPRPFMVERGHDDGVAPDQWVASEYAKIRRVYVKLGLADQTQIEFFDGPHTINGQGTFRFLHRHLNWPAPTQSP